MNEAPDYLVEFTHEVAEELYATLPAIVCVGGDSR